MTIINSVSKCYYLRNLVKMDIVTLQKVQSKLSYYLEARHVYDHATLGLALAINTHLCNLMLITNTPTMIGILSISTKCCHPILLVFVVRYYHSLPFLIVLDINICSWDFNPSVLSATPVLYRAFRFALGQTLFLIKPYLLSFLFKSFQ